MIGKNQMKIYKFTKYNYSIFFGRLKKNFFTNIKKWLLDLNYLYLVFRPFVWFVFINEFMFEFFALEGESMLPTFDSFGNIALIGKFYKNFSNKENNYKRGDIVCVFNPTNAKMKMCKRIIYLEGDEFQLNNNSIKIPPNYVWVEGDNKNNSWDSRKFGPIPKHLILGKIRLIIWPKLIFY
jgi:signal peptidase I